MTRTTLVYFVHDIAARAPVADEFLGKPGEIVSAMDPARRARQLLVRIGDTKYLADVIHERLNELFLRRGGFGGDLEQLEDLPAPAVHDALKDRVLAWGGNRRYALWLFRLMARSDDLPLFRELEADPDLSLADIAHEYLVDPSRYAF